MGKFALECKMKGEKVDQIEPLSCCRYWGADDCLLRITATPEADKVLQKLWESGQIQIILTCDLE